MTVMRKLIPKPHLKEPEDGYCVVGPKGELIVDGNHQDEVFQKRKDALAMLSAENLKNGWGVARCSVVPRP